MFEMLLSNLWVIMSSLWVCFAVYGVWYSAKAKDYAPISSAEARQLWVIHRQGSRCGSRRWRQVRNRGTAVGFECGCGFKYMQRRPIAARLPSNGVQLRSGGFDASEARNRAS